MTAKAIRGHAAAARSSLSAPRMTILRASSGNGRCNALASSHGARIHTSLLVGGQDHRHGLEMDRLDDGVRRCREKAVDLMRSRHRLRLGAGGPEVGRRRLATSLRTKSRMPASTSDSAFVALIVAAGLVPIVWLPEKWSATDLRVASNSQTALDTSRGLSPGAAAAPRMVIPPATSDTSLGYAAEGGHPMPEWKLGRMYADGDGVIQDDVRAFEYFSRIANAHAEDSPSAPQATSPHREEPCVSPLECLPR